MRECFLVVLAGALWGGSAHADTPSAAARRLIQLTPAASRAKLLAPFTEKARSDWHYTPRTRAGLRWRDMNAAQREAATALLGTVLTDPGLAKVRRVMALEIPLGELEHSGSFRDPENYAIAVFGDASGDAGAHWGWRIEGHHLSLHFTLDGDRYVATLPQFMGANPAAVPSGIKVTGGPPPGTRVLGKEEDVARRVVAALDARLRARVVIAARPYGDIVSRNAAVVSPLALAGVPLAELPEAQRAALLELAAVFAEHLRPDLAEARLDRVRAEKPESIRFAWAGSIEPGHPHYFRLQGSTFLIELDNSGGNHIHSVWRDFHGDWGRDILREHYQNDHPHP